jgi:hypothetical protein
MGDLITGFALRRAVQEAFKNLSSVQFIPELERAEPSLRIVLRGMPLVHYEVFARCRATLFVRGETRPCLIPGRLVLEEVSSNIKCHFQFEAEQPVLLGTIRRGQSRIPATNIVQLDFSFAWKTYRVTNEFLLQEGGAK